MLTRLAISKMQRLRLRSLSLIFLRNISSSLPLEIIICNDSFGGLRNIHQTREGGRIVQSYLYQSDSSVPFKAGYLLSIQGGPGWADAEAAIQAR